MRPAFAYKQPDFYEIKPENNAYLHNNMGLRYMDEKIYYAAIQEFKIAISLNPNTQATALYYNNLGEAYMAIGYPDYAKDCFERAIKQYNLNFKFYQNLVQSFKGMKILKTKLKQYSTQNSKNPLDRVILGLLYIENGELKKGIVTLDEFTLSEPDLLITPAIKKYLVKVVDQLYDF